MEQQLNEYNRWDFSRVLFHLCLPPSLNKLLGKIPSIKVALQKSQQIPPKKKGHLDAQILLGLREDSAVGLLFPDYSSSISKMATY